jgi:hypothetical protein
MTSWSSTNKLGLIIEELDAIVSMIFDETNVMVLFISQPESYEYLMIVLN